MLVLSSHFLLLLNQSIILTLLPCPLCFNSLRYAFRFDSGTVIRAVDLIPLNAFFPTLFSFLDLMYIVLSPLQPRNALAPIVVTLAPIFTETMYFIFFSALALTAVTLKVFPPIFTLSGISTRPDVFGCTVGKDNLGIV